MSMPLPPGYDNDMDYKYNSPLVDAVYKGDVEALRFMLAEKWDRDIGNYKGITPLMATMEMADCGMAAMLLDVGAHIHESKWNDEQPIWYATRSGAECVGLLLARGADPNGGLAEKGSAPLAVAKDAETARLLIAAGAEVELPDYKNLTPLCHAILKGKKKLVMELLDAGADPNWSDGLPLKYCADISNKEISGLLKKAGTRLS